MSPKTTDKGSLPTISVKIQKVFDDGKKIRAVANASISNAFAVRGIKVIDSEKGLFVAMPSNSYKNNNGETKYHDIFHPITAKARLALTDSVITAYKTAIAKGMSEDVSQVEDEKNDLTQSM